MIQPGTCLLRKLSSEAYRAQGDKTFISFYRKSVSNEIVLRESGAIRLTVRAMG